MQKRETIRKKDKIRVGRVWLTKKLRSLRQCRTYGLILTSVSAYRFFDHKNWFSDSNYLQNHVWCVSGVSFQSSINNLRKKNTVKTKSWDYENSSPMFSMEVLSYRARIFPSSIWCQEATFFHYLWSGFEKKCCTTPSYWIVFWSWTQSFGDETALNSRT